MPYFCELYDQKNKKWIKHEYKTLTACRKACWENVMTTDAYQIPITMSRTGKTVIGIVDRLDTNGYVTYSSYGNKDYGRYVLKKNGEKCKLINKSQNYNRRMYLE